MGKKGSALAWAVISMTVILIFVTGALAIGRVYAARSINENISNQTYLTARSMVNAIVSKIDGYSKIFDSDTTVFDYQNSLIPAVGDVIDLSDFVLDGEELACTGYVEFSSPDVLLVSVTASQGDISSTVNAYLKVIEEHIGSDLSKSFIGLYAGGLLQLKKTKTIATSPDTDVYIQDYTHPGGGGNKGRIDVGGTLYTSINGVEQSHNINGTPTTWSQIKPFREITIINDVRLDEPYICLNDNTGFSPELTAGATHLISDGQPVGLTYTGNYDTDGYLDMMYYIDFGSTYYIKITPGCNVDLSFYVLRKINETPPNVYIFVDGENEFGDTSNLSIDFLDSDNTYYNLYILGGDGSTVTLNETQAADTIYGSIIGDEVIINDHVYFDYIPPEDLPEINQSTVDEESSTQVKHTWSFVKYEKGN